jgi:hypothetical protein
MLFACYGAYAPNLEDDRLRENVRFRRNVAKFRQKDHRLNLEIRLNEPGS